MFSTLDVTINASLRQHHHPLFHPHGISHIRISRSRVAHHVESRNIARERNLVRLIKCLVRYERSALSSLKCKLACSSLKRCIYKWFELNYKLANSKIPVISSGDCSRCCDAVCKRRKLDLTQRIVNFQRNFTATSQWGVSWCDRMEVLSLKFTGYSLIIGEGLLLPQSETFLPIRLKTEEFRLWEATRIPLKLTKFPVNQNLKLLQWNDRKFWSISLGWLESC